MVTAYDSEAPSHITTSPEITPGCEGSVVTETGTLRTVLLPHALLAVTDIEPDVAPGVVVMVFDCDVPVHPDGNVHVYDVAFATLAIEYVFPDPSQVDVLPAIVPGCEGTDETETAIVTGVVVKQLLLAVTETLPAEVVDVAAIEFDVELPVHPDGNAQVYVVAPATTSTE